MAKIINKKKSKIKRKKNLRIKINLKKLLIKLMTQL